MSTFNLTLFVALRSAGVDEVRARTVVEEFDKTIDARYGLHKESLATKGDLADCQKRIVEKLQVTDARIAESKVDLIKFIVGAMIAQGGLIVALIKLLQP